MKNHSVKSLTVAESTRKQCNDNLCFFRSLALLLHGNQRLEVETSKLFNQFWRINRFDWSCKHSSCLYGKYCNSGEHRSNRFFPVRHWHCRWMYAGELARRSVGEYSNTVRLLRYNSRICCLQYQRSVENLSLSIVWSTHQKSSRLVATLDHLQRVEHVFPKIVYQLRETRFEKLDSFGILYTDDQKFQEHGNIWFLNQFLFKTTNSTIPILQLGSASTFQYLCQFLRTLLKNQSFYAIPIQEIWFRHLLMRSIG